MEVVTAISQFMGLPMCHRAWVRPDTFQDVTDLVDQSFIGGFSSSFYHPLFGHVLDADSWAQLRWEHMLGFPFNFPEDPEEEEAQTDGAGDTSSSTSDVTVCYEETPPPRHGNAPQNTP